jgi:uncharacterized membrane protein YdjX (TVP38/TMEM64 family)
MLGYMGTWKGLTIVRIIFAPLADTISYAAGLTRISFKEYFWATFPLLILHIIITNNVADIFVKSRMTYVVVVSVAMLISMTFILFRKKIRKFFTNLDL